jgi:hypothetical protein
MRTVSADRKETNPTPTSRSKAVRVATAMPSAVGQRCFTKPAPLGGDAHEGVVRQVCAVERAPIGRYYQLHAEAIARRRDRVLGEPLVALTPLDLSATLALEFSEKFLANALLYLLRIEAVHATRGEAHGLASSRSRGFC